MRTRRRMGWATRSSARAAKRASALRTLYVIHSTSEPVRASCRESWRALPFLPVDAYPLPLRPQSSASSSHYVHLRLRVPRRVTQDHRRLPLWPLLERCHLPSRRLPHGGRPSASYRLRMTRTRTMSRTTAMTSPRTPTMSTTPRPLRALHERPTTRRMSAISASTGRCTS